MPSADFKELQQAFADHIRDPAHAPPPPGADPERMRRYAALFFNNIDTLLNNSMVRLRAALTDDDWQRLTRRFFRDCPQHSPFVVDMPARFVAFLDDLESALTPWQRALADLDLATYRCRVTDDNPETPAALDPDGDLLADHPVHQTDGLTPTTAPAPEPAFLFLLRDPEGQVRIHALSAASARLLELTLDHPQRSGQALLAQLAEEFGVTVDQLADFGAAQLRQWRIDGILIGTTPATAAEA